MVWPRYARCHHSIWSGQGAGVTIVYSVLKSGPVWSFDPFWRQLVAEILDFGWTATELMATSCMWSPHWLQPVATGFYEDQLPYQLQPAATGCANPQRAEVHKTTLITVNN